MNINIKPEILKDLKEALTKEEKTAARFEMVDFGCSGPIFDIVLDEQKEDDVCEEIDGVKFVVENKLELGVRNPEIIKNGNKFTVKRTPCGC